MSRIEQVTDPVTNHGEGPEWFEGESKLRFVDMLAGDILTFSQETGDLTRTHVAEVAAVIRPRSTGGFLVATDRDVLLTRDGIVFRKSATVFTDPLVRFNDGTCAPDGSFLCGTMAYANTADVGNVYRILADGTISSILRDVTISNGIAFGPDGTTVYYVDSATNRVDRFSYVGGQLEDRTPFVEISPADGTPDGICVDADGGLWVALWGGGAVHHYNVDGHLDEVIEVPAAQVTACTLGGLDGKQLYITTSRHGMSSPEPLAGSLFCVSAPSAGLPSHSYAG